MKESFTMQNLLKKSLLSAASIALLTVASHGAFAQTASVTATAEVANSLTLATAQQLNFGSFVAVGDTGQTASVIVDTAGAVTVSTTGGTAITAVVDDSAATAAQITVADGADGATLNLSFENPTLPTNGTDTFDWGDLTTSWNGGGDSTINTAAGFPQTDTEVYDQTFGGGTNTLDIGATITTQDPEVAYTDGVYTGGFDVVFSY